MAAFSESEINEAKERVRRMKERASSYIDSQEKEEENVHSRVHEEKMQDHPEENAHRGEHGGDSNRRKSEVNETLSNSEGENDDQSFIILMLILLLSHEGADNALILALLYLLF